MGCRIFVGREAGSTDFDKAVLFDSVTMQAFGPIFESHDHAESFIQWCLRETNCDPRSLELPALWSQHDAWREKVKETECLCGEDWHESDESLPHKTWCPKY